MCVGRRQRKRDIRDRVDTGHAKRTGIRAQVEATFEDTYSEIREMQQKNAGGVSNFSPSRANAAIDIGADKPPPPRSTPTINALGKEAIQTLIDERGLGVLLGFRDLLIDLGAN